MSEEKSLERYYVKSMLPRQNSKPWFIVYDRTKKRPNGHAVVSVETSENTAKSKANALNKFGSANP